MWHLKRNVARAGVVVALVAGVGACGDSSASTTPSSAETATGRRSVELGGAAWSTVYGFGGAWIQVDPPVDQVVKVDAASGRVTVTIDGGRAAAIAEDAVWG